MNPKISVIMPAYNAESFIDKAIESILDQTFQDFEFIIVEDGSDDSTMDIIQDYKHQDSRIRVLSHIENKGIPYCLNLGFNKSKGKYIARMDADDISVSGRLERQVRFMDRNEEIIVSSAWMESIGENEGEIWKSPTNHEEILTCLFFKNCIFHPVSIIRKEPLVSNKLEYNVNYHKAQDYKLWLDLSRYGRFANIPEVLHYYRIHEEQKSNKEFNSSNGAIVDQLRRRKERPGIREQMLMEFLEREITLNEVEIHAKFFFEIPFSDLQTQKELQSWVDYLKRVNKTTQKYLEPNFSDLLDETLLRTKAKSFKYSISNQKRFHPKILWDLFFSEKKYYSAFCVRELAYMTFNSLTGRRNRWYTEGVDE